MFEGPIEPPETERSARDSHAAMVEALLAGEGFAQVAAIAEEGAGAPVRILLPRPGSEGTSGSSAERYVARLVSGEESHPPEEVTELVPIVAHGEVQGAVLMFGEGRPGAREYLQVAAVAALTGVAVLNAREDATRAGERGLIADLLVGREPRPSEVVRRARLRGCELGDGLVALCVDPDETAPGMLIATIAAERPEALAELCDGRLFVLLPGRMEEARRLASLLGARARTALSSRYREAADARSALEEAAVLLAMAEAGGRSTTERPTWDSIRLLFRSFVADPEELIRFSRDAVGPVLDHDERHGSELEATFWAYQESNCNMNETAKASFTHRHTIANRLARIEELTGLDPSRSHDRELLSLALKAHLVATLAGALRPPSPPASP